MLCLVVFPRTPTEAMRVLQTRHSGCEKNPKINKKNNSNKTYWTSGDVIQAVHFSECFISCFIQRDDQLDGSGPSKRFGLQNLPSAPFEVFYE